MKLSTKNRRSFGEHAAYTLIELCVAMGISSVVLCSLMAFSMYGSRSFAAMGNYSDLDGQSRRAVDLLGRELRQATSLLEMQTNGTAKWLTVTNTLKSFGVKVVYDSASRTLQLQKTGQPNQTVLTECDQWDYKIYTRAPNVTSTSIDFNIATTNTECKLIDMSWKCSRTIMGQKVNTESVQTAKIVLRNKVS